MLYIGPKIYIMVIIFKLMVLSKITSAIAMLLFSQEADGRMNVKENLSKA